MTIKQGQGLIITCNNPQGCTWNCPIDGGCNDNTYICPLSSCSLACNSCHGTDIRSSVGIATIYCYPGNTCSNMAMSTETNRSSINLQCWSTDSCTDITFSCTSNTANNCECTDGGSNACINGVYGTYLHADSGHIVFNTKSPTIDPTISPSNHPTIPSTHPTISPSNNPTTFPSNYPTITPSNNPTISPSNHPTMFQRVLPVSPTSAPWLGKHGILISILFEYDSHSGSANISIVTLRDILTAVIDEEIVNNSICLEKRDYNIDIMNKNQNTILMNATIIVCAQQDATILAEELAGNLETDFIEQINDQLVISKVDVHLDVIEEVAIMETTTSPTIYVNVSSSKDDESIINIIIYIPISIILLSLVLGILYWKRHHKNLNNDIIYQPGEVEMEHNPSIKQTEGNNGDAIDDDNIIQYGDNEGAVNLYENESVDSQPLNENIYENAAEHDHGLIINTRKNTGKNMDEINSIFIVFVTYLILYYLCLHFV